MLVAFATLLLAAQAPPPAETAAADPAYARDGRLAVSVRGDLWVLAGGDSGTWIRITSGPASDRQLAWTPDGSALVFASDRAGRFDLWRVGIGSAGATGERASRRRRSGRESRRWAPRATSSSCAVPAPRRAWFAGTRTAPSAW
ncbi:MAG: PD40 domain-containing protein [Gemmatimonadetes bacterium]|nr:PD40 domain-containing protein [Gemmatimonadota bacterium]MBI2402857.1 PD40 domain-containing protein [Gemmatimonadota bacterium]